MTKRTQQTTKTLQSLTVGIVCTAVALGAGQGVLLGIMGAAVVAGFVVGWRA